MVKQITAMHKSRRVKITDINPHLTCVLCSGYLIDATTIIECLHSFCRTCIVKYLENNKYCPICDVQVHKTKPLLNIRSDQTLQDIVYKLVPGLFQNEMCRRRDFYAKHPEHKPSSAEESGEVTQFSHIYTADESISLSLEYYNNNITLDNIDNNVDTKILTNPSRRFLRCPAAVSVSHLQKLIRAKYGLSNEHRVDILYLNDKLSDDFTLMDIAYIYLWRRKGPLHLTYRIFEVSKRIKLNDVDSNDEKTDTKSDPSTNGNEWKEVQLQISENGIMSVTNIAAEIKLAEQPLVTDVTEIPELTPILVKPEKLVGASMEPEGIREEKLKENDVKLGKHKLEDVSDLEPNAKVAKINLAEAAKTVKNVQQLSRNHPLKIHSQAIIKSHTPPSVASTVVKSQPKINKIVTNNNNNAVKTAVQKDQPITPTSVQNSLPIPKLVTPKTAVQRLVPCPEKHAKTPQTCSSPSPSATAVTAPVSTTVTATASLAITTLSVASVVSTSTATATATSQSVTTVATTALASTTTASVSATATLVSTASPVIAPPLTSVTAVSLSTIMTTLTHTSSESNIPKYTQAGHSTETTTTTSKTGENIQHIQKQPVSSPVVVSCIQSSKVSIVPKKSPVKIGTPIGYKTLRDPPKAWNPQISRQNLAKTNIFNTNNGASTSDLSKADPKAKPAKFFKMRNNMPRYLGNPASGVKPMYQVREGDKSPPDPRKILELKKLEGKMNNNNKDDKDVDVKNKPEIKTKQSIIKIDPKTLRPILDKVESPSCTEVSEMKINQSSVPIFNPLRNQKSQASPKLDRRSPKCSTYDIAPKSPLDRNSKTSKPLNSPTTKKDKVNINFTPPNPFIPNLTSPNMAPNQFLYPNYPAYDPRVMNNLSAYHNLPFSMFYSQPRLNYPGLSSQSLSLSPSLMSSLNLEVNKNLRKTYDIPAMLQLSPTLEKKKPATNATNAKKEENLKIPDKVEQKPVAKSIVKKVQKPEKIEEKQIKDAKPVVQKENSLEKVKEIEKIGNDVKEEKIVDEPEVKDKVEEILNKKEEKIEKVSELVVDPVKT